MILVTVNATAVLAAGVTGATAVLVGLFGFLGSRLTAGAVARQGEREHERWEREQMSGERARRAAAYETFLVVERRLSGMTLTVDTVTGDDFHAMMEEWWPAVIRVLLYGTEDVRTAVGELTDAYAGMWVDHLAGTSRGEFDRHFRVAMDATGANRQAARNAVTEAMRADTAVAGLRA